MMMTMMTTWHKPRIWYTLQFKMALIFIVQLKWTSPFLLTQRATSWFSHWSLTLFGRLYLKSYRPTSTNWRTMHIIGKSRRPFSLNPKYLRFDAQFMIEERKKTAILRLIGWFPCTLLQQLITNLCNAGQWRINRQYYEQRYLKRWKSASSSSYILTKNDRERENFDFL